MNSTLSNITYSRVTRGIKLFLILTFIGLIIVFYHSSFSETLVHLTSFRLSYLCLACSLVILDFIIEGARIYIFAAKVHKGLSFGSCVRAAAANIFIGGITPSQTGGGIGQIYVLYKEGMRILDATVTSFLGFLGTAVFLPICAILITLFAQPEIDSYSFEIFSNTTVFIFCLIMMAVISSLIAPGRFEAAIKFLIRKFPRVKRLLEKNNRDEYIIQLVKDYHELMLYFIKYGKRYLLGGFILTALLFFNKFVIAYVVVRGLGLEAAFFDVIYLQMILLLIFFFSPTPGASGVAEISTVIVMGNIVPVSFEGSFILLWRFFTLFAGMIVGAIIIFGYLLKNPQHDNSQQKL